MWFKPFLYNMTRRTLSQVDNPYRLTCIESSVRFEINHTDEVILR